MAEVTGNIRVSPTQHRRLPDPLAGLERQRINLIEISASDGNTIALNLIRQNSGAWQAQIMIRSRKKNRRASNNPETATIISAINSPVDLAVVGLKEPDYRFDCKTQRRNCAYQNRMKKTPTDSGYYLQVDENLPVFLRSILWMTWLP